MRGRPPKASNLTPPVGKMGKLTASVADKKQADVRKAKGEDESDDDDRPKKSKAKANGKSNGKANGAVSKNKKR